MLIFFPWFVATKKTSGDPPGGIRCHNYFFFFPCWPFYFFVCNWFLPLWVLGLPFLPPTFRSPLSSAALICSFTPESTHTFLSQLLGFFGGDCILGSICKLLHTPVLYHGNRTAWADTIFQTVVTSLLTNWWYKVRCVDCETVRLGHFQVWRAVISNTSLQLDHKACVPQALVLGPVLPHASFKDLGDRTRGCLQ